MTEVRITKPAARLDKVLGDYLSETYSRSQITRWFKDHRVTDTDGRPVKAGLPVREGDRFLVSIPEAPPTGLVPEILPLDIVYEDPSILVINKPQGMVVHPGAGNRTGTLANALAGYTERLSRPDAAPMRPGIVHRIDKDTSGLLVVARTDAAHRTLAESLRARRIHRHYTAAVYGQLKEARGLIDGPLARDPGHRTRMAVVTGGRRAVTHYRTVARLKHAALLALALETGRTHQIRAHLAAIGHPVVGDPLYAPGRPTFGMPGQALHAHELILPHPDTGEMLTFRAPLPPVWTHLLTELAAEPDDRARWIVGDGIDWPTVGTHTPDPEDPDDDEDPEDPS